jgi:hypothetical protein
MIVNEKEMAKIQKEMKQNDRDYIRQRFKRGELAEKIYPKKRFWVNYYTDEINKLESDIVGKQHVIKKYKKELAKLNG